MKKNDKKRLPRVDFRGAIKAMSEEELDKFRTIMKVPDQSHYKLLGTRKNKIADIVASGYYYLRNSPAMFDEYDNDVWNALRDTLGDYKTVDYMFYNMSL